MKSFGQRLRRLREKQKLSIAELARESGVPYETIYRAEQGLHHEPRLPQVVKLARALHVSLDVLAGLYEDEIDSQRTRASQESHAYDVRR